MSNDHRSRRSRTHNQPTSSHIRECRQYRAAAPGSPCICSNVYTSSQVDYGDSTGQASYNIDTYASSGTGDNSVAVAQHETNTVADSVSTIGYQSNRTYHDTAVFDPPAHNHPFYYGTPSEDDDGVGAATYAPSFANRHSYPSNNSFDSYPDAEQASPYSQTPTSTGLTPYPPNSSYPAFALDSGVSHTLAQANYMSPNAADVVPTTSSPLGVEEWNEDSSMEADTPSGQMSTPDHRYDRARAGSGDSGDSSISTQVFQGSAV